MTKLRYTNALRPNYTGFTLLEVLVALVIFSAVLVGVAQLTDRTTSETKASVAAAHMRVIGEAAIAYIKQNETTGVNLRANTNATNPFVITVEDLQNAANGGFLDPSYGATNPYGHGVCVLVVKPNAASNRLFAMVVASGGVAIDDELQLASLASQLGVGGGAIYQDSIGVVPQATVQDVIQGAGGTWQVNLAAAPGNAFRQASINNVPCANGNAHAVTFGHPFMALWLTELALGGGATGDYLYRDAQVGNEGWNTMNTPIIMETNASVAEGGLCGTTASNPLGAIARDTTLGVVLSCVDTNADGLGDTWRRAGSRFWGDPADTFGALGTCDASNERQTRVVRNPSVGTGPRAYTCDGINTWLPLAVADDGSLTVPGALDVTGNADIGGNLNVDGNTILGDGVGSDQTDVFGELFLRTAQTKGQSCPGQSYGRENLTDRLLYCNPVTNTWADLASSGSIVAYTYRDTGPDIMVFNLNRPPNPGPFRNSYNYINTPSISCQGRTLATVLYGLNFYVDQSWGDSGFGRHREDVMAESFFYVNGVNVDRLEVGGNVRSGYEIVGQGIPFSSMVEASCVGDQISLSATIAHTEIEKVFSIRNAWVTVILN